MPKSSTVDVRPGSKYASGLLGALWQMAPLNSFLFQYLRQNQFFIRSQNENIVSKNESIALNNISTYKYFCKINILPIRMRHNFFFGRSFSLCKKVEVVFSFSPLVTRKDQSKFSFLCHVSRHQNKKIKIKVGMAGTEFRNFQ